MKQKNNKATISAAMLIISTGFSVAIGLGHPISDNGLELICIVLPILIASITSK